MTAKHNDRNDLSRNDRSDSSCTERNRSASLVQDAAVSDAQQPEGLTAKLLLALALSWPTNMRIETMLRKSISSGLFAVLMSIVICAQTKAQGVDVRAANELLIRQLQEDFARQRARARAREDAEDAADESQRNSLDFSQFGRPADPQLADAPNNSRGVTCTTIGLGGGDSITKCK
jgi:hypothetical protein